MTKRRTSFLLGTILFISLAFRLAGIQYDLPYIYHPDEPIYITTVQNIFKRGDLNPHFFNYPSLFFYINTAAYVPYYFTSKALGQYQMRIEIPAPETLAMGVTRIDSPDPVLLSRVVTVLFGVATVVLVYYLGKKIACKTNVGLLAAVLIAVFPSNVAHSRYIAPDTFVAFFAAAAMLLILFVYREGKSWQYLLAGFVAGLTASSKYNGALIFLPLLVAHIFRYGRDFWKEPKFFLSAAAAVLGFFLTTPYSLLDFPTFYRDFRFEASHYSTGHAGMEGDTLRWYLDYMWQTGGLIFVFAAAEIIRGLVTRSKETMLLAAFPTVYFVFISSFVVRNDRTFLPLTPFLFVLAASFILFLADRVRTVFPRLHGVPGTAAVTGFIAILLLLPISKCVSDTVLLFTMKSREESRVWIENTLPERSKIAIESYSPYIDPQRYVVTGFFKMTDQTADWYVENEYDYLVFSKAMYGRFYAEPDLYGEEIRRYDTFFHRFEQVNAFYDDSTHVLIYKVR